MADLCGVAALWGGVAADWAQAVALAAAVISGGAEQESETVHGRSFSSV